MPFFTSDQHCPAPTSTSDRCTRNDWLKKTALHLCESLWAVLKWDHQRNNLYSAWGRIKHSRLTADPDHQPGSTSGLLWNQGVWSHLVPVWNQHQLLEPAPASGTKSRIYSLENNWTGWETVKGLMVSQGMDVWVKCKETQGLIKSTLAGLQREINTAQRIIGWTLPAPMDIGTRRATASWGASTPSSPEPRIQNQRQLHFSKVFFYNYLSD